VTAPGRILVAGDWHGDRKWALKVIGQARELLASEDRKVILQLGDFGIWPGAGGVEYIHDLAAGLADDEHELLFTDGNHEDFSWLELVEQGKRHPGGRSYPPFSIAPSIWWLPRGYRWEWHGRTWLACGGGVSLDRVIRTEGRDWWPQEEITDEQEAAIIAGGHADVLVSHDRPSGVAHTFPDRPSWWDQHDVDRSERHEERLQRITDAVQPSHILHGHLHRYYSRTCDFGYGPVSVNGLDTNGTPGNYAVLDVRTMAWEQPGGES
jgi:hypothetical protein